MPRRVPPSTPRVAWIPLGTQLAILDAFAGATAGGVVSQYFGSSAVFVLCGLLTLSWLLVAWPMSAPTAVSVRP